jgi:hypothetical protein
VRIGLYGRSGDPCELLVSLHKGDEVRIGAALAQPLSLEVPPSSTPAWQRVEFAAPGLLGPHPGKLWLVVRAPKGDFWWHGGTDGAAFTQRSADDGATYANVNGRPSVHVSVKEIDPASGNPCPLQPLSLAWRDGLLNADVAAVQGHEAALPPEFRRFWIAQGTGHQSLLHTIGSLGGLLRFTFVCQRDAGLTVSDAVLTYDPWNS